MDTHTYLLARARTHTSAHRGIDGASERAREIETETDGRVERERVCALGVSEREKTTKCALSHGIKK